MRIRFKEAIFLAFIATVILAPLAAAQAAPFAYITNFTSDTVSVIDTDTHSVIDTVAVGDNPYGVAVNPAGTRVYVANSKDGLFDPQPPFIVSVIDTATNSVIDTVVVGTIPYGVAINPAGTRVYVTNQMDDTVSVIDTATNSVIDTVAVGSFPLGVAVNPNGTLVYVVNGWDYTVSVIDAATNSVIDTVTVGSGPRGATVNPAGTRVYVINQGDDTVSVIDAATNSVIDTVAVGDQPWHVAVNPAGTRVYVTNYITGTVSVIDAATNSVIDTVTVGSGPKGVAVNPAGTRVYVANSGGWGDVSVIDTATNSVMDTVAVDSHPVAFGDFIGPELSHTYYSLADYYPMTQGSTWTYQWTENGESGTATSTINGFERVKGVRTTKFFYDGDYNCEAFDSEGLKRYKEYDVGWGYTIYTPPFKQISAQMYVGQTHKSSSISKDYDLNGNLMGEAKDTTSATLEGLEDVTVPAGSFTNCLKFFWFDTWEPSSGWLSGWLGTGQGTCWFARDVGLVKEVETERLYDDQGQLVDESTSMDELTSYNISPNNSTVTRPNGGEVLPSGSIYTIEWTPFPGATSYKLKYSMNNGKTWKPIGSGITGTSHNWPVPIPSKNKKKCLVKVIGYDGTGKKMGADRSDSTFAIEVVKVTYPNGKELLISTGTPTITWITNGTKKSVAKLILKYTKNGGKTWSKIDTLTEDKGSYSWTAPDVPKPTAKCKVKVILKDAKGITVGSDTSDSYFTIEPVP